MNTCPQCHASFVRRRSHQTFCSSACRIQHKNDRKPRRTQRRWGNHTPALGVLRSLAKLVSEAAQRPADPWGDVKEFWEKHKDDENVRAALSVGRLERKKPKPSAFYTTREWLDLRYKVLAARGSKCECCGATPQGSGRAMQVDHIKPRSKYPHLQLDPANLQVLCTECNLGKRDIDETDWRPASP